MMARYGDVKSGLIGKEVSFSVGVDKGKRVEVFDIKPWNESLDQVFYQKRLVSVLVSDDVEVKIYE